MELLVDEIARGLAEDEPGLDPALRPGRFEDVADPLEAVESAAEKRVGRGEGEVRPDDGPEGSDARVPGVELDEGIPPRLEEAGPALGVDDPEVRGQIPLPLLAGEEVLEVFDRGAGAQGQLHESAIARAVELLRGGAEVVGLGVHNGETGGVLAAPDLGRRAGVFGDDDGDEVVFRALEESQLVVPVGGVAVLPHQRPAVGRGLAGDDGQRARGRGLDEQRQAGGDGKGCGDPVMSVSHDGGFSSDR